LNHCVSPKMLFHVDGVRRCLWIVATIKPTVYPPGYIWTLKATVKWYWRGENWRTQKNLC
jgi:hypothetical protein